MYCADFASEDFTAHVIATPGDLHYPMTMAAVDVGLRVLCYYPKRVVISRSFILLKCPWLVIK